MKYKPGIRTYFIVVFLTIFLLSIFFINRYFLNQQELVKESIDRIDVTNFVQDLNLATAQDTINAIQFLNGFNSAKALTTTSMIESKSYSWAFMIFIAIIAIALFVLIIIKFSNPIIELQRATELIQKGHFDVNLPEKGIRELKELKKSFNKMSTELFNTQQKLVESEKEAIWKDLSRALAHEIKNPLTPIQLALQRLEEKYSEDKNDFYAYFPNASEIIMNEVENLLKIAKNFSTFAKLLVPDKEIFNPAIVLDTIIDSYSADYTINKEFVKNVKVNFDPQHFYQIVTNILQNALDATERDTPIDIKLYEEHNLLIVSIEDYGCGIEREDLNRIFNPYFTMKTNGSGLGLALVKKFIDSNGSTIYVNSKPGIGTKFRFSMEIA